MLLRPLYHPVTIGSVQISGNLFLAPVAGYSDRAFRSICRTNGASFTYTEMVSSEALVRSSGKTEQLMERAPNEDIYAVQLFGSDAETMSAATKLIVEKVNPSVIDVNAGCPVPKIVKQGAGSTLTRDASRLNSIVLAIKRTLKDIGHADIPVTVKIRSGWDASSITFKEAAASAYDAGVAAITLHPRTRAQGYEGKSNWQYLADLVSEYQGKIPVFGSGDVFSPQDAKKMIEQTGVDAVMFARGAMGNPFIFNQTKELLETGSYTELPAALRIKTGLQELMLLEADKGEDVACREMRKRFCAYTKGIQGGANLRLGIIKCSTIGDYNTLFSEYLR